MSVTTVLPVIENAWVVLLVTGHAFLPCLGDSPVDHYRTDMTQISHGGGS